MLKVKCVVFPPLVATNRNVNIKIVCVCYLLGNLLSFLFNHLLLLISVINNVLPTNQQLALHRLATRRNDQHQQQITCKGHTH